MNLPDGVSEERWIDRVNRLYREPEKGGRLPPETEKSLAINDAQFRADKEMLDEIHLMLRHICTRMGA